MKRENMGGERKKGRSRYDLRKGEREEGEEE